MKLIFLCVFLAFFSIIYTTYSDSSILCKVILYCFNGLNLFLSGINVAKYYENKSLMETLERRKNMLRSF
jgi:hypothetical protein